MNSDQRIAVESAIAQWWDDPRTSLQKRTLANLDIISKCDWGPLLTRRLNLLLGSSWTLSDTRSAIDQLLANLSKQSHEKCLVVLRTLTNGWATSSRYHENHVQKCVFGCRSICPRPSNDTCADSLQHYLFCPILRGMIMHIFKSESFHTTDFLCLSKNPKISWVWTAHQMYHYLRFTRPWLSHAPMHRGELAERWAAVLRHGLASAEM